MGQNSSRRRGASEVPVEVVTDDASTVCPIDFEPFQSPVVTRCGHTFCKDCLNGALRMRSSCPICRQPVSSRDIRNNIALGSDTFKVVSSTAQQRIQSSEGVVFIGPLPQSAVCPVHHGLLNEPVVAGCGHTFCRVCTPRKCPECRRTVQRSSLYPNHAAGSWVRSLPIKCDYAVAEMEHPTLDSALTCDTVVTYAQRDSHQSSCNLAPVQCPHSEHCRVPLRTGDLPTHADKCRYLPCPSGLRSCRFRGNKADLQRHLSSAAGDHFREIEAHAKHEREQLIASLERRLASETSKMHSERAKFRRFRDRSAVFFLLLGILIGHVIFTHLATLQQRQQVENGEGASSFSDYHYTIGSGSAMNGRSPSRADPYHDSSSYTDSVPLLFLVTTALEWSLAVVSLLLSAVWFAVGGVLSGIAFLFSLVRQVAQVLLETMVLGICFCILAGALRGRRQATSAMAAGAATGTKLQRMWGCVQRSLRQAFVPRSRSRTSATPRDSQSSSERWST